MRIVYFQASLHSQYGGPAKTMTDQAVAMARAGHTVDLLTQEVGDAKVPEVPGLTVSTIAPATLPMWTMAPGRSSCIDRFVKGADAFHVMGVFTVANMQFSWRAHKFGVPYFISLAGMLDDDCFDVKPLRKKAYMALAGRRWLDGARAIHCTAQEELIESGRFFRKEQGVIIPNIVEIDPFRQVPKADLAHERYEVLRSGKPAIVFLGRLHPIKGLDRLIQAAGELRRRGREFSIVLVGPGPDEYIADLKRQAQQAGIGDDLHFAGLVTGDLKVSVLRSARVFAMPSLHENFGIALVEAMLAGTPAVATKGLKIWRELASSGGATIAEPGPAAFADALDRYLTDPAFARTTGDAARTWALDFLEPRRIIAQFEAMYRLPAAASAKETRPAPRLAQ